MLVATRAEAQRTESLTAGTRLRVSVADSLRQDSFGPRARTLIGTLARVSPDTLWLHVGGPDTVRLARATLRHVATSGGASRVASAFELGVFTGLVYGIVAHSVAHEGERWRRAREFGGAAAGLGAVVGALRPFERWRTAR